ncbi:MAG: thermonuclease family protein [Rhodospirillaceae bacterium]|nr:thermonuclease family protein [Rhodospirillaceae bacterium]
MLGVALVAVALPETGFAATSDRVRVIDGDTIDISGQRIRLHGIDTPEAKQTCQREGFIWLCGAVATKVLRKLIGDTQVTCTQRDMDRYGRIVAVCYVNGLNLNAAMVQSGMALAYRKYSNDYIGQEASAKAAQRGLWAGKFVAPWEWRRGKRLASETALNDNPTGCRIKGNVGSKGDRIYHMPGGRWYDRTVITASKGERWFCSEGEAKAAGWQRAGTPAFAMPRSNTGQSPTVTEPIKACCKICRKGQACGNSCISRRYICRRPPGCACNG